MKRDETGEEEEEKAEEGMGWSWSGVGKRTSVTFRIKVES